MRTPGRLLRIPIALICLLVLLPLASLDAHQPGRGGVLRFAPAGDPPTLEPHRTTALMAAYSVGRG